MKNEVTICVSYSKTIEMELPDDCIYEDVVREIREKHLPPLSTTADAEGWVEDEFDYIVE